MPEIESSNYYSTVVEMCESLPEGSWVFWDVDETIFQEGAGPCRHFMEVMSSLEGRDDLHMGMLSGCSQDAMDGYRTLLRAYGYNFECVVSDVRGNNKILYIQNFMRDKHGSWLLIDDGTPTSEVNSELLANHIITWS